MSHVEQMQICIQNVQSLNEILGIVVNNQMEYLYGSKSNT